MNKSIYRTFLVGGNLAAFLCIVAMVAAGGGISGQEIAPVIIPIVLLGMIAHLVFIYRVWGSIQDGDPRMSPGKAVGLLFIPIFNIYWIFQVYGGFATDFNQYIAEKGIQSPKLSNAIFVFTVILMIIPIPLANWIVQWIAIGKACDGANAVRAA